MAEDDRTRRELPYERLYREWEESSWSATAIDFSVDGRHWREKFDERQREAALWNYSMFLKGVEAESRALTAVLHAAPAPAHALFLATQVADEARNRVFLDRFMREVAGLGHDAASTSEAVDRHVTWGFRRLLDELERLADALRRHPEDRALLTQVVAVLHIVVEGVLAIPGEHFIQRHVDRSGVMPGFAEGLGHIARDEKRHVAFGMTILTRLIGSSTELHHAAVRTWNRVVRWMVGVFVPPKLDRSYVECFGFRLEEIYAFGLELFESRLTEMGVAPTEVRLLSFDDRSLGYDRRAERLLTLIEARILGDDRVEPKPTPEALEILFEGTARALDLEVARTLGGAIEWSFDDAEPWHLVVTDGHAEAKPGRAGAPALSLEISAADWAKIAVGRSDARWAMLKRRLRVHGHWQAKAKLSKLFH